MESAILRIQLRSDGINVSTKAASQGGEKGDKKVEKGFRYFRSPVRAIVLPDRHSVLSFGDSLQGP